MESQNELSDQSSDAIAAAHAQAAAQKHMIDAGNALGVVLTQRAERSGGVNALQVEIYTTLLVEHINLLTAIIVQAGIADNNVVMRTLGDAYLRKAKELGGGPGILVAQGVSAALSGRRQ